jgi:glutaredoxin
MSVGRGCGGSEMCHHALKDEGGAWGRHGFPHGSEPKASDIRVTLYHAAGCHLCERALAVVQDARGELGFELELVDIEGDPELEARYRERLPVVEIDGEQAFTYFVPPDAFRARFDVPPERL